MLFFALYNFAIMNKIVLFASGAGSNAENIIRYFQNSKSEKVCHVFCNNADALVIEKATRLGVKVTIFQKHELTSTVLAQLKEVNPALIVLAGFLLKLPSEIVNEFPEKIINIHPALLPKYGGRGMYGSNVHKAVLENGEKETGITIHYVNEHYDEGNIIFQERVSISDCTSIDEIAEKIHELEQKHFPITIEKILHTKN